MQPITNLEELVARFENSTFDYKTTYDLAVPSTRYDIAKDVAAFANAFGGTIVVGVFERGGKACRLDGVADVAKLTKETATALQQYCVPTPSTPEEHAIPVSPSEAMRLLAASGAPRPNGAITLVTMNVRPDPRGPIGVRPFNQGEGQSGPLGHAYRFPIRLDDQTRFMDPTELPMWMNSHERRVAIQLRRAIDETSTRPVRVFHRIGMLQNQQKFLLAKLESVDEDRMIAIFSERVDQASPGPVHVPLTFIASVWRDIGDGSWSVAVNGTIYPNASNINSGAFRFVPYLGGA